MLDGTADGPAVEAEDEGAEKDLVPPAGARVNHGGSHIIRYGRIVSIIHLLHDRGGYRAIADRRVLWQR